jgi:hypothetical protein
MMLRSPVAAVAHCPLPLLATCMAATLASGAILLWDTRKEALESYCIVRTHSNALVYGAFHPHLPLFITLSKVGDVDIWPVCSVGTGVTREYDAGGWLRNNWVT